MPTAAEFFAGIGMFRLGMEAAGYTVIWANDISPLKQSVYEANFGDAEFLLRDIRDVNGHEVPTVDIAAAGFPCIDVSLAGKRAGMTGEHSSLFYEFSRVITEMGERAPETVIIENVTGLISSNGGQDLRAIISELNDLGYTCDLLIVDAAWFVPQSRRRLFILASRSTSSRQAIHHDGRLRPFVLHGFVSLNRDLKIVLRHLVRPTQADVSLSDIMLALPDDDPLWWDAEQMETFDSTVVAPHQQILLSRSMFEPERWVSAHHRSRGGPIHWELRSDGIAGCLTAARGGSNRAAAVRVASDGHRTRWLTGREFARLQGAPEHFEIAMLTEDEARQCFGDAVCVPVVEWIMGNVLAADTDASAVTQRHLSASSAH